jgi:ABC-type microcin C transport system permease subunit YejE
MIKWPKLFPGEESNKARTQHRQLWLVRKFVAKSIMISLLSSVDKEVKEAFQQQSM